MAKPEIVPQALAINQESVDWWNDHDPKPLLLQCESPIEQIFLAAMCGKLELKFNAHFNWMCGTFLGGHPSYSQIFDVIVKVQHPIRNYRVDLLIYLTRFWCRGSDHTPMLSSFVVELDGHDFHERTKEQAARDKQRDRELLLEGYKVVRFTGSEVFRDPYKCVEEIAELLDGEANRIFYEHYQRGELDVLLMGPRQ